MSFNYCIKIVKIKTARISLYSEYQKDSECQKDNKLNCNLLLLKYQKEQNSNIIYHEDKFKSLVRRKLECLYFLKYYREYNFNITRSINHFISKLENHLLNLWYKEENSDIFSMIFYCIYRYLEYQKENSNVIHWIQTPSTITRISQRK